MLKLRDVINCIFVHSPKNLILTIFSLFLNCRPKTMTQGDRLNQIKAKKQAASCGNVPVEKLKGHVRVKSVPSRTLVNNSNNNSGSGSAATTSAALSPSRPLTRMQAEAVAAASGKNQVGLIDFSSGYSGSRYSGSGYSGYSGTGYSGYSF